MEQLIIKGHKILQENHYLSDISASYLYEKLTDCLPSEVNGRQYRLELMDYIQSDIRFKFINHYGYNSSFYMPSDIKNLLKLRQGQENSTYWFYSDVLSLLLKVHFEDKIIELSLSSVSLDTINEYIKSIEKYKHTKSDFEVGIIYETGHGLAVKRVEISAVEMDIKLNYGEKFIDIYNNIVNKINKNTTGAIILHGTYGTGKSTLIKHLCGSFKDRLFIFIPTAMVDSLVSPSLISLLLEHPNSILIIEDAEKAIMSREENPENASLVSTILNLTDGILGNILNIMTILTFNTKRKNIDEGLLRKGRLLLEWEFKKLSVDESKKLAKHLGMNENKIDKEMSLADIYHMNDNTFHIEKEESKIGFGV